MDLLIRIIFIVTIMQFVGCASEEENNVGIENPTDPNTVFNLFPTNYLTEGYNEAYVLSGHEELSSDTFTGNFTLLTHTETMFNSVSAISISKVLELTNTNNGAVATQSGLNYYSTELTSLNYLGYSGISNSRITESASTTTIPQTGKIGDNGSVGTYQDNYDDTKEVSWSIHDAGNGNAKLKLVTTTSPNQLGTVLKIEEEIYTITPEGLRLSIEIRIEYPYNGVTINMTGNNT